jgi:hypothetical protein
MILLHRRYHAMQGGPWCGSATTHALHDESMICDTDRTSDGERSVQAASLRVTLVRAAGTAPEGTRPYFRVALECGGA